MKRIILLSVLIVLLVQVNELFSQSAKYKKAEIQYTNLNYKKALSLYLKEYETANTTFKNNVLAERIANCYRLLNDSKNAQQWYGIAVNQKKPHKINFLYYAQMLQINGDYENAEIWFDKYSTSIKNNSTAMNYLLEKKSIQTFEKQSSLHEIKIMPFNSDFSDMGPAFYNDQLFFSSTRDTFSIIRNGWDGEPFYDIYTTDISKSDSIGKVKKVDKNINSPYHDGPVCFDAKKDIMYFTRSSERSKKTKSKEQLVKLSLYKAEKTKNGWKNIEKLWFNSSEYSIGHPTISSDGMVLVFSSDMDGGYGGTDLYFSFWNDSNWSEPINLGKKINTNADEMFPYFAADGKLYFSSNGRQGFGGLDIYYTWPSFENIQEIKNMGVPVNSTYDDFSLIIDKNEKGYFSSNRPNDKFKNDNIYGFSTYHYPNAINDTLVINLDVAVNDKVAIDLFKNITDKDNDIIKDSVKILSTGLFDREYSINNQGQFVYWVGKSFDNVKKVEYEITDARGLKDTASILIVMKGNTPPNANPDNLTAAKNGKGRVIDILKNDFDKEDNILLDSVQILEQPRHGGEIVCERRYFYYQPPKDFIGKDYCIYKIVDSRGGTDIDTIYIDVLPEFMGQNVAEGNRLDLSIYFEYNKWKIEYLESKKLDKVVDFLKENPSIVSQVTGHTDSKGTDKYNLFLSVKRAQATANYLSMKGIDEERLKVKGEGEKYQIYKSISGSNDDINSINRRTTIKVLNY